MTLALNILLATCGLIGSFTAIGGDTWRKGNVAWIHRITVRGWIAITCLCLAFAAGITKEIITHQRSKVKDAKRAEHNRQVLGKFSQIEALLTKMSLKIIKQSSNPEDESTQFRKTVKDSGFPDIAERLYRPTDRVKTGINVRSEPSAASPVIGRVEPGTPLRFLQVVPHWILVQTPDGTKGWVSKAWVEMINK